jgi:C1A family cysteine protease
LSGVFYKILIHLVYIKVICFIVTYKYNREEEIFVRKYSVKKDTRDLRDSHFRSFKYVSPKELPKSIDMRGKMSPIVDQGQLGSCTANAIASGLREYLELQAGQQLTRLSRLFLYWHERELEGTVNEDSGAMLRDGMKVLNKLGVCPEPDFPYDINQFRQKPSPQAEADAVNFRINEYHRILDLAALKSALAEGLPVVIGFTVYESFESEKVARTGIVPIPDKKEQVLGGHAVLAVGYDDDKQLVIIRNSWGSSWGDQGYCYFPYGMFRGKKYIMDMWTGK